MSDETFERTTESGWHPVNIGHLVMGLAFLCFVGAWALVRYTHGRGLVWLVLATAAVSYAVLARWIYGLVGVPFALYALPSFIARGKARPASHALVAVLVAVAIPMWRNHLLRVQRADAIAALVKAARTPGLRPIEATARDLFRRPFVAEELRGADVVVFDPPRQGAQAQAHALATSKVPLVIAVSCNPATFARDAKILVDGGYKLKAVTPIDQFRYSPHVELVARLER